MSKPTDSAVTMTFRVPPHLVEAFTEATDGFFAQAHEGTTPAQRAAELRVADRDDALDSLALLLDIAQDDSSQGAVIAMFLVSLYRALPFDLTELRALDADSFEHCLAVLRLDAQHLTPIRSYFPDGAEVWQAVIDRCRVERTESKPSAEEASLDGQTYVAQYVAYSDAPGYRNVTLFATIQGEAQPKRAIGLYLCPKDCGRLAEDLAQVHRKAWETGSPGDAEPGEHRPTWL
ncbi:DUF7673 family protein [Caballeronia glebae]|uniref:DUF7673 family protein n=1 Tax=Caballeronia glebae TaxID=1777143 RepID=UPI0038B8E7E9